MPDDKATGQAIAVPEHGSAGVGEPPEIILRVTEVHQDFPVQGRRMVRALRGVSLHLRSGETLGIVGESGSGKSTLLRSIVLAPAPTRGTVELEGVDLTAASTSTMRRMRRRLAYIFQDPFAAMDPRFRIDEIIAEPLMGANLSSSDREARVEELLGLVGLEAGHYARRRASQLSGGQLQRVGIARALASDPSVLLCDEIVSALDVSLQAQVLNMLEDLRQRLAISALFVSHDLGVVRHVSDRVMVLYLGVVTEIAPATSIYEAPAHPYTEALLSAVPGSAVKSPPLTGELPSPLDPPSGCPFRTRCPRAASKCAEEMPPLRSFGPDHVAACHFPLREPLAAGV